jgi:hypothetical protein
LFIAYDEHHVLEEDEGVVGVKKKSLHIFDEKTKGIKRGGFPFKN